MTALEHLDRLLAEPGRQAVLPRELKGSASAAYRALRRRCDDGTLQRVGHGVYARPRARLFDIVPEVLPKLGFKILPRPRLTNLNFKSGGNVWRVDRPCRLLLVKHGVAAAFESPQGSLYELRKPRMTPMQKLPSREEVDLHRGSFDRCHSYARAEKDLIVQKALEAWEKFRHPDATLALDGGTCLVLYHGLQRRFSEDLDIRVILNEELERGSAARRVEAFRSVSADFARHVHRAVPFLETTRKGRFRKRDGRFESHIYRYHGRQPHREVVEGLKLELVQEPARLPLQEREGLRGLDVPLIGAFEIAMGKWRALSTWLAGRKYTGGDYVRHPTDLAAMSGAPGFERDAVRGAWAELVGARRGPGITQALRELQNPVWEANYTDYMRRMGQLPVRSGRSAFAHPRWRPVLRRVARMALDLELVPERDRPEIKGMATLNRGQRREAQGPAR